MAAATRSLTETQFDNDVIPFTQFGQQKGDGTVDIKSIVWREVALYEPGNVVQWILYLHRHQHLESNLLILAVINILGLGAVYPLQWVIYAETRLPCILMDIFLEPDMFSDQAGAFKACSQFIDPSSVSMLIFHSTECLIRDRGFSTIPFLPPCWHAPSQSCGETQQSMCQRTHTSYEGLLSNFME